MAGIKSSCPDIFNSGIPDETGRRVVLFGTTPGGREIVSTVEKKNVNIVNSIMELNETVSNYNSENKKDINSIIIVACPGDDVSEAKDVDTIANKINVLISSIVIQNSRSIPLSDINSFSNLRASSDMLVITSDKNYLEYMLDCLI